MPYAKCPTCGYDRSVPAAMVGLKTQCRICQAEFVVDAEGRTRPPRQTLKVAERQRPHVATRDMIKAGVLTLGPVALAFCLILVGFRIAKVMKEHRQTVAATSPRAPVPVPQTVPGPAPRTAPAKPKPRPEPKAESPPVFPPVTPPGHRQPEPEPEPRPPVEPADPKPGPAPEPPVPDDGFPKAGQGKPKKAEPPDPGDRPGDGDVAPEVRAAVKAALHQLASKNPAERKKGCEVLGELGPGAKSVRRALCAAMLDGNVPVRTAAADALKKVDPTMAEFAVSLYVNHAAESLRQAAAGRKAFEPLTPIVLDLAARQAASGHVIAGCHGAEEPLGLCVLTLARIAPDDEAANRFVLSLLLFKSATPIRHDVVKIRAAAITHVLEMRHKKQATRSLLELIRVDDKNRGAAIAALEHTVDEDTTPTVIKALETWRYNADPGIRRLVADVTERMRAKK